MASNSNKRKNRLGKDYPDDDEINQAIKDYNGAGNVQDDEAGPDAEMEGGNETDESDEEQPVPVKTKASPELMGVVGRVTEEDEYDEEGRDGDMDVIDMDAKKKPVVYAELNIPECACCGKKWKMSTSGVITDGCGCRIHPICDVCKKCAGHCDRSTGHERVARA